MIIYSGLFVHILGFCLFIHETDILKIWSHFIMLLESFVIHKTLVDKVFWKIIKFERAFCYSNVHQIFSILLMGFNILHKKCHMCLYFLMHMYCILWTNVVNFDSESPYWLKRFKFCNHGLKQKCAFDYNQGLHANNNNFIYNMGHVWFQYWYSILEFTFKIQFWYLIDKSI
jgi:hypothetical protein